LNKSSLNDGNTGIRATAEKIDTVVDVFRIVQRFGLYAVIGFHLFFDLAIRLQMGDTANFNLNLAAGITVKCMVARKEPHNKPVFIP
jgi:hypothetical protein